jgi:dienelactone hydrolase
MPRRSSIVLVACLFAPAPACGGDPAAPDGGTIGPGWESAATTTDDGSIIIQKVSYRSGGLRIFGQVCRPAGPGPFPLIVANHSGVTGLPAWNGGACAQAARSGRVQIESSFRGQDGSGGVVELCLGEVDDVLRMLEIALAMPEVDRARVAMWGASHGGCVTTRALQRGARVNAAVSVFGIANMRTEYELWASQLAAGVGPIVQYRMLIDLAKAGIGGPPEDFPDDYLRRSPIELAAEVPAAIPFLIAHGTADPIVPPRQSCELAQRLGVQGHHFDAQHQLVSTTPAGCEAVWTPSAAAIGSWPATRYLLVHDGLADLVGGPATGLDADVESFLTAKLR